MTKRKWSIKSFAKQFDGRAQNLLRAHTRSDGEPTALELLQLYNIQKLGMDSSMQNLRIVPLFFSFSVSGSSEDGGNSVR